jgi:hypothetical protein
MKRIAGFALPLLVIMLAGALVHGAKPDRIRAAHSTHALNSVPCETCHAAATSHAGSDNLLPSMDACSSCHDVSDAQQCATCHTNPDEPGPAERRTTVAQKFPHATHLAAGTDCATCHGRTDAAEPELPAKALCRTCHATASGQSDCVLCHAESESLRPTSHTTGWGEVHPSAARLDQASCSDCHTEQDCQDCHAGDNVRPRVHPLNYAFNHALDARGGEITCAGCHEDPQYCQACHLAERIMPRNHSRADWVLAQSGGRHAEEGVLDIESCVACHDEGRAAPICAKCHGR